eukprot:SM000185S04026  [mRNA]  locus=s185:42297:43262:- [translate_table: standard]
MGGGMDCRKNVHIEDWGTARENLEKVFRLNRRTVPVAIFFGLVVPFAVYRGIVSEFHKLDEDAGVPLRKFM